jgi:hypothetical protein
MSLTTAEMEAKARAEDYNHNQYDAATNPFGMGGIGYKTPGGAGLEGNWSQSIRDAATLAEGVARLAGEASGDAGDAQAAADEAATYLRSTTSSSSVTIGTGSKTFVLADVRQFTNQDFVLAVNQADEDEWVFGQVTSWTPGTKTLIIITLIARIYGHEYFLDIAMVYALMSFVTTIGIAKYLEKGALD